MLVAVFVSGLAACVALLALDARQGAAVVLDQMIAATKVAVFLNAGVSPQESALVGARLKADPGVGAAYFRSKADTAGSVAQAVGGPVAPGLAFPDAWILSLRAPGPQSTSGESSLTSTTERLRMMATALPGVESVHFDRVWVAHLERWVGGFRAAATVAWGAILVGLLGSLLGIYDLANRAMWRHSTNALLPTYETDARVITYTSFIVAAASGVAAFLLHALAAFILSYFVTSAPVAMQTWLGVFGRSSSEDTLAVAAAILVTALMAGWLAARRE